MSILFSKNFLKRFFRRNSSKLKMKKKRRERATSFTFLILERSHDNIDVPMSSPFFSWYIGSHIESSAPCRSYSPSICNDNSRHCEFLNCIGLPVPLEFQTQSLLYLPSFCYTHYNISFDCCQEENYLDEIRLNFSLEKKGISPLYLAKTFKTLSIASG